MPLVAGDKAKQAEFTDRQKAERERYAAIAAEEEAKTEAAMLALRNSIAKKMGVEASELSMIICRRGRRATFPSR